MCCPPTVALRDPPPARSTTPLSLLLLLDRALALSARIERPASDQQIIARAIPESFTSCFNLFHSSFHSALLVNQRHRWDIYSSLKCLSVGCGVNGQQQQRLKGGNKSLSKTRECSYGTRPLCASLRVEALLQHEIAPTSNCSTF